MVKLTKTEMQVVVDYLLVQHDSLFEYIMNDMDSDGECRKDELVLRKFLMIANQKGLNIDRALYPMVDKVTKIKAKR